MKNKAEDFFIKIFCYGEGKMVKELLKKYEEYRTEIAICKRFRHELSGELQRISKAMDCLNKCIALLGNEEAEIIRKMYFEHESIKMVADKYGYTKSGMQYKRDKIVMKLTYLYERASHYINGGTE